MELLNISWNAQYRDAEGKEQLVHPEDMFSHEQRGNMDRSRLLQPDDGREVSVQEGLLQLRQIIPAHTCKIPVCSVFFQKKSPGDLRKLILPAIICSPS